MYIFRTATRQSIVKIALNFTNLCSYSFLYSATFVYGIQLALSVLGKYWSSYSYFCKFVDGALRSVHKLAKKKKKIKKKNRKKKGREQYFPNTARTS